MVGEQINEMRIGTKVCAPIPHDNCGNEDHDELCNSIPYF